MNLKTRQYDNKLKKVVEKEIPVRREIDELRVGECILCQHATISMKNIEKDVAVVHRKYFKRISGIVRSQLLDEDIETEAWVRIK